MFHNASFSKSIFFVDCIKLSGINFLFFFYDYTAKYMKGYVKSHVKEIKNVFYLKKKKKIPNEETISSKIIN